ncbi:double C2-like domain-containing protein gamma isoform X2 [Bos indicus x Bos taurus]|uniref:double C2-like domain-containing protein gamma isoform X2 n=1 Tax=Bos indicus x Bos taurus TaxID=30522 RepID=UPI000F7D29F8|nr:double C2-like domain-containing protein gamma isoform X2 [Bos indicus x Bos taurus]
MMVVKITLRQSANCGGKGPLGWRAGSCGLLGSGGAPSPAPSASPTATRWLSRVTSVSTQQPPRQVQGLSERSRLPPRTLHDALSDARWPCLDPRPPVTPVRSAPQPQLDPEPEGDSDDSTALGTLEFTLLFDTDNSTLHCTAHRAKGLKPPASGSMDTFVKANLLPGASKVRARCRPPPLPLGQASQLRTRTVRGTRGPVWEETLTYHGFTLQDARRKTLRLCVCEDPWLRRRRRVPPLGELRVPLRKLVPNRARSFDVCLERRRLTKRPKSLDTARGMSLYEEVEAELASEERGRVLLSLCYSSQRGGLLVGVLRCAHLAPMDANGYSDPFVRLFLHPNTGRKSKYKTSVRKKTLNPEFNEEFFYAGPREELAQKTLLVSVWDYDLGTADDFIGGVQLSSRAGGERQQHWRECLGHSDRRLELWHPLDGAPLQLSD